MVVAGFSGALALLARVLPRHHGRAVAVEDPGSPGQSGLLARGGLRLVPIEVDGEGLRVDELASSGARIAVVTPASSSPSPSWPSSTASASWLACLNRWRGWWAGRC
jgi:GntR family transcriptional regulator/MocR family aminotransferase